MKKRFIAGATCPQCHKLDTLVVYDQGPLKVFECVDCSYSESMGDSEPSRQDKNKDYQKSENMIQWIDIENKQ